MGYPTVKTDVVTIGAGLTVDLRPPATQSFRVTEIGSDQWAGVLPNAIPQANVSLFDGLIQGEFLRSVDLRGWYRKQNIVIDHEHYLRVTNMAGVAANVSYSAELLRYSGVGNSIVRSDIITVGTGLTTDIRPPVADAEDWVIYDFCSSDWLGAPPNAVPNVEVDMNDGTLTARIMDSTEIRQWEPEIKLFVTRAQYITLTNAGAANANVGWSAELLRHKGVGNTVVRSSIQAAGAGLNVDFRPPDGEEWEVSVIGSGTWVGISPLQFPDITASIFDATIGSIIETATSWHNHGNAMSLKIDHDHYLRVNDASGLGQSIGISAQLIQRYA